ncbi:hypothetical protein [Gottfriedia solisilvae]|uniref:hypothetical protein n=1 Tax=Gottfriedia solisilvae TaxID=1516104 RepID=UPI003D2EA833
MSKDSIRVEVTFLEKQGMSSVLDYVTADVKFETAMLMMKADVVKVQGIRFKVNTSEVTASGKLIFDKAEKL